MEFDSQVYLLSSKFIQDYPSAQYPELMSKMGRPYTCLLIETHDDFFICVPFRSNIRHNNAYLFKGTARSKKSRSGLDYTKIVLIKDGDYIDSAARAIVDQDEYNEAMKNLPRIVQETNNYVDSYAGHVKGTALLHPREFERKYKFSTLPYFHDILGLTSPKAN